jgi:hypothetical protein
MNFTARQKIQQGGSAVKSGSMRASGIERTAFLADVHSKGVSLNIPVQDAAALTGLSVSKLNLYRLKGGGPRFQKFGRSVRYRLADVMAFMNAPTYSSTSEISASISRRERAGTGAAA